MFNCEARCLGLTTLVADPKTNDGKQTWEVLCGAGKPGGCKGPDLDSLEELSRTVGKARGAKKSTYIPPVMPLALSNSFRLPKLK